MKPTLYELSSKYIQAMDFLTDPENEIDNQTAVDTIESMEGEIEDKMLNIARMIATIEAEAEAVREVARKQTYRARTSENRAEWLRDYLLKNMQATGIDQAKANDILIKIAKTPAKVNVINEALIPDSFLRWKSSPDLTLIKEAGGCDGCEITTGYRVSIK